MTLHPFSVEDLVPKEDNFYPRTQLYSIKLEVEAAFWPSGLLPVSEWVMAEREELTKVKDPHLLKISTRRWVQGATCVQQDAHSGKGNV